MTNVPLSSQVASLLMQKLLMLKLLRLWPPLLHHLHLRGVGICS
jgi:hypothetical protein